LFLTFLIFFGAIFPLRAQTAVLENYNLTRYTDENGLPQNSVKSIAADQAGFIWLATENGLVRFDGQHFNVFSKFNLSINDDRFFAIQPSMENSGLNKNNRRLIAAADGYEFAVIQDGKTVADSSYKRLIKSLPFIERGFSKTYIATGSPTYIPDMDVGKEHYIIPVSNGNGTFYLCDRVSVSFYDRGKKKSRISLNNHFKNFFIINGHLYYYNLNGTITGIEQSSISQFSLSGDILADPLYKGTKEGVSVYWNGANEMAFLYLNKNIYLLSTGRNGKMSTKLLVRNFDLISRNIHTFYYNSVDQSLFLGSVTEGFFVLRRQSFLTLTASGTEMDNVFYAQGNYRDNTVITPKGFVIGLNESLGAATVQRFPAFKDAGDDGRGLVVDKNGLIYVKHFNFLYQLDSYGSKVLNKWDLTDEIKQIYLGRDGVIWLGMKSNGLYRLDPNRLDSGPSFFVKGALTAVSYITARSDEWLLVGTEHGLFQLNVVTRKQQLLSGTDKMFIKSIHVSKSEEIWMTARDKGIMLFRENKLVVFPLDKNKYLAAAHCVFEDLNGFLWIPANKGLFSLQKNDFLRYAEEKIKGNDLSGTELFYQYYDKQDGFLTNEFNGGCQPCAVRLPNGYVSLPSLKGLVWFKPEKVVNPSQKGTILFDKVVYNEKLYHGLSDILSIPVSAKRIRFYFSVPYFGHPDNLQCSYAFVKRGSENELPEWTPMITSDLSIYFSALNSGEYTLLVKKINGFGKDNYTIKRLFITVPLLWYETMWAKFVFGVIMLIFIYCILQIRLYRLNRQNIKLEGKIAMRTQELETSRIEQGKQLQIMSRLLTSMSHDIQSPLNFIVRTSVSVPKLIKRGEFEEVSEIVGLIRESSENMSALVADLLNYIKAYVYGKSMNFEEIQLALIVEDKLAVFKGMNELNGNQVVTSIPADMTVFSDYQMLYIVLNNLIDNATKFTSNGVINVHAYQTETKIHLVISNNGLPLSPGLLLMFNQRSTTFGGNNTERSPTGLGFFLVKEITELIHVGLEVTQTETTNFVLIFDKYHE